MALRLLHASIGIGQEAPPVVDDREDGLFTVMSPIGHTPDMTPVAPESIPTGTDGRPLHRQHLPRTLGSTARGAPRFGCCADQLQQPYGVDILERREGGRGSERVPDRLV